MSDISKIAEQLKIMASNTAASSSDGMSELEKLATIAIIHDQLPKHDTLSPKTANAVDGVIGVARKAKSVGKFLAMTGLIGGAGYAGSKKGKREGFTRGADKAYHDSLPYVSRDINRRKALEYVASRLSGSGQSKQANSALKDGLKGALAILLPAGSYAAGKHLGSKKGRKQGYEAGLRHALNRSQYEQARSARAIQYINSKRQPPKGGQ